MVDLAGVAATWLCVLCLFARSRRLALLSPAVASHALARFIPVLGSPVLAGAAFGFFRLQHGMDEGIPLLLTGLAAFAMIVVLLGALAPQVVRGLAMLGVVVVFVAGGLGVG